MQLFHNTTTDTIKAKKQSGPRVTSAIIVDDNENIVHLLSDFLKILGIKVLGKAFNGKEAVALYKKQKPDIVILDIMMPQYDGFHALERIMQINMNAKILVITADFRAETTHRIKNMRGVEIIHKPFDLNQVMDSVRKLLGSSARVIAYHSTQYSLKQIDL